MSFVQERLWFLDQLRPGSDAYNVPAALRFKGELNVPALETALNAVVQRHEALRSHFSYADGELTQVVKPALQLKISPHEMPGKSHASQDAALEGWLNAEAQRPFDLAAGPLLRAGLLRVSPNDHVFVLVMHHATCDGWSLALFFRELEIFYRASSSGQPLPTLPDLPIEYIDFACWQRQSMQGAVLERELEYWKHKLSGAPPALALPADLSPNEHSPARAGRRSVLITKEIAEAMADLGQQESLTPFMVLMSALVLTLHQWTKQKDLVIGTVVAGRNRRETEGVIGCFMNFVPIRTRILGPETGLEILGKVKASVLEGQNHQECPFEKIVEAVNPERRADQNPLYNVALLLQNFPTNLFPSPTLEVAQVPLSAESALLDLRFEAEQTNAGLAIGCEYRTELFEESTVEELLKSFLQVVSRLVQTPHARLDELGVTENLERQAQAARIRLERQRIAVASTFTAEPIAQPLSYWLKELDVAATVEFAPYNQVFQQLLDPASLLAGNARGLNVILLRFEDWRGESCGGQGLEATRATQNIERSLGEFVSGVKAASARSAVPSLVVVCPASARFGSGAESEGFHSRLEAALVKGLTGVPGIHLLTSAELSRCYPVKDCLDSTSDELAHVPYTPLFFSALATAVARKFHALRRAPYKVIVLDCDQTLWAGVCGEDSAEGICLDPPRRALQEFMRAQHEAGMLLCLNSKNQEDDVRAVFARRKEMPLAWEHFAARRLNWQLKSENLKALAQELRLGLDSFIFVDDNPIECAEVVANCPEVLTLQLPEDPSVIPQFLQHCWAFDHVALTDEDRRRTQLHRQEQERQQLRSQAPSLADFLDALELEIKLEPVSAEHFSRVAQLSQRTNQFNCAGNRFSLAELQGWLSSNEALTVHVRDRFGDYGLVGAMLYRFREAALDVDSFMLSCRALGRGVEHRMLARLCEIARERRLDWVDIHFVPTDRNKPAADFLEAIG
ncbi:MAG: HAD-IIIC family phosphatase, partial [Limisphaerales bacterium]